MMTHFLKISSKHFSEIAAGHKMTEFMKKDRDFKMGDTVCFLELADDGNLLTGRMMEVRLDSVLGVSHVDFKDEYCAFIVHVLTIGTANHDMIIDIN